MVRGLVRHQTRLLIVAMSAICTTLTAVVYFIARNVH